MRLIASQVSCIRDGVAKHFAATSHVWLFGSRIDDQLRGGDIDLAIPDQFSTRFSKLQNVMGEKLFPAVLELTKEPGNLVAFVDKLQRLEKIGVIHSADDWLLLREMRNAFSHEYPDDPAIQASIINKAYQLAAELISTLEGVKAFSARYL